MEIICRIKNQLPMRSVSTDNNSRTLNIIGFELVSGGDTIYAELMGDRALQLNQADTTAGHNTLSHDYYYKASITCRATERVKDGVTYRGNSLYINDINVL